MKCPCVECEKRGCGTFHDQCETYLEYKKYLDNIRETARRSKQKPELRTYRCPEHSPFRMKRR